LSAWTCRDGCGTMATMIFIGYFEASNVDRESNATFQIITNATSITEADSHFRQKMLSIWESGGFLREYPTVLPRRVIALEEAADGCILLNVSTWPGSDVEDMFQIVPEQVTTYRVDEYDDAALTLSVQTTPIYAELPNVNSRGISWALVASGSDNSDSQHQ